MPPRLSFAAMGRGARFWPLWQDLLAPKPISWRISKASSQPIRAPGAGIESWTSWTSIARSVWCAGWRLSGSGTEAGSQGHERRVAQPSEPGGLFERQDASDGVALYAQASFVAQSDRDLAFYLGAQTAQAWLLHLGGGSAAEGLGFHCLLQPHHGQTVQMDRPGQAAGGLNCWAI